MIIPVNQGGNYLGRPVYQRYPRALRATAGAALAAGGYYGRQWLPSWFAQKNRVNQSIKSRKRKTYKKGPRKFRGRTLKSKVRDLTKQVNASTGKLIYRTRNTDRVLASVNEQSWLSMYSDSISNLETVLGQLRFFDPSNPGTLLTGNGSTGTYQREYHFKTIYFNGTFRNNYQVPVKLKVYILKVKLDTSITPLAALDNGLTDNSNVTKNNPLVSMSDSDQLTDLWKIHKVHTKFLNPGMQCSVIHSEKDIMYSPDLSDNHTSSYQKKNKSFYVVASVEGVLGHDTTADEQGFLQAGVDMSWDVKYEVRYDAGADLVYFYNSNSSDSFTNGGLTSSMPVADNIGYSVA